MDITQTEAAAFDKALKANAGADYPKFLTFGKAWTAQEKKIKTARKALGKSFDGFYSPAPGHCPQYPLLNAPTAAQIDARMKGERDANVSKRLNATKKALTTLATEIKAYNKEVAAGSAIVQPI